MVVLPRASIGARVTGAFVAVISIPGILILGRRVSSGLTPILSVDGAIVAWSLFMGVYCFVYVGGTFAITGRVPSHLSRLSAWAAPKFRLRRKTTRRDSPSMCVIYAVVFAAAALLLLLASTLDWSSQSSLIEISGHVISTTRTNRSKSGPQIDIFVRGDGRTYHLVQHDLSDTAPGLLTLQDGDSVIARAVPDKLGRNLNWFWELKRDGATILSYSDTSKDFERRKARTLIFAHAAGAISFALFVLGIVLRRYFGAWRDQA